MRVALSDLLGLTCVRYEATTAAEIRVLNQKLRKAIEDEGRVARIEGPFSNDSLDNFQRGDRHD